MTPEEHVYASIRSNPNLTADDYQKFTKLRKDEFKSAMTRLSAKGHIEKTKSGWRIK